MFWVDINGGDKKKKPLNIEILGFLWIFRNEDLILQMS